MGEKEQLERLPKLNPYLLITKKNAQNMRWIPPHMTDCFKDNKKGIVSRWHKKIESGHWELLFHTWKCYDDTYNLAYNLARKVGAVPNMTKFSCDVIYRVNPYSKYFPTDQDLDLLWHGVSGFQQFTNSDIPPP